MTGFGSRPSAGVLTVPEIGRTEDGVPYVRDPENPGRWKPASVAVKDVAFAAYMLGAINGASVEDNGFEAWWSDNYGFLEDARVEAER